MNHWSYLDGRLVPKISKRHFFQDIQNSFNGVVDIVLEPHQKNFFENISKSVGATPSRSFDTKRVVEDISVAQRPKFFHQLTTDLWETNGESFKKISWMVFEKSIILFKLTACLWPAPVIEQAKLTGAGHKHAVNLNKMINYSKTIQDIFLKLLPFVSHKSVVNWWKNFGHCATDVFHDPFCVKTLHGRSAYTLEIFSQKFFWRGSRPISAIPYKEF